MRELGEEGGAGFMTKGMTESSSFSHATADMPGDRMFRFPFKADL